MDSIDPEAQLWITITGAAAAGILALIGSWLGNQLSHHSEHERWKRDKRYEVYVRCLNPVVQLEKQLLHYHRDGFETFRDMPIPKLADYPLGEWEIWMSKEARQAAIAAFAVYVTALQTVMKTADPDMLGNPVSIPQLNEYKEKFIKQVKKDLNI